MTDKPLSPAGSGGRSNLGAGSRIIGELSFPGTVESPGYVKGRVEAAAIVIEETGEVEGEVPAASIAIKGRFNGEVSLSDRLVLAAVLGVVGVRSQRHLGRAARRRAGSAGRRPPRARAAPHRAGQ